MALLTEDIREELKFISKHWRLLGRPTFAILISENDMQDPQVNFLDTTLINTLSIQFGEMVKLLAELRQGHCEGDTGHTTGSRDGQPLVTLAGRFRAPKM